MLTLFKPFSTGLELKNADETPEAAFNNFDFSDEQKNLMNSFHVLQECSTARHKFAKQCKAQLPTFFKGDFSTDPDAEALSEFDNDEMDFFFFFAVLTQRNVGRYCCRTI